jgi:hypothetical protein
MSTLTLTQEQKLEKAETFVGFSTIPRDQLNDELIAKILVSINDFLVMKGGSPLPLGTGYYEAAMTALKRHGIFVSHVHPEFIDKPIADMYASFQLHVLAGKVGDRLPTLVDQDKINRGLMDDINVAKRLPASCVSDEALKAAILDKPKRKVEVLVDLGRLHIVAELLTDGFWPHRESGVPSRVEGAENAIKLRLKRNSYEDNDKIWLNALIKTHPIEEVVSLLKTPARRKLMVELYDRSEIAHLIKDDKQAKGLYLSDALGL